MIFTTPQVSKSFIALSMCIYLGFASGDAHTSDSYFMYHYRSDVGSDLEVAAASLV